jgi:hypothetical protein
MLELVEEPERHQRYRIYSDYMIINEKEMLVL